MAGTFSYVLVPFHVLFNKTADKATLKVPLLHGNYDSLDPFIQCHTSHWVCSINDPSFNLFII